MRKDENATFIFLLSLPFLPLPLQRETQYPLSLPPPPQKASEHIKRFAWVNVARTGLFSSETGGRNKSVSILAETEKQEVLCSDCH